MPTPPLHPLGRQSLVVSSNPACRWAFGMTTYLAFVDPQACVRWAVDFIHPYLDESGEYGSMVTRSAQFLRGVLDNPMDADLSEMEYVAEEAWNHRSAAIGGGPLARLICAAMGIAELAKPGEAVRLTDSRIFPPEKDHRETAETLICEQSATAIHMIGYHRPGVPQAVAESFTQEACCAELPQVFDIESRFEWTWSELVYKMAKLRTPEGYYLEFKDCLVDRKLFSGPFPSREVMNDHVERLMYSPKVPILVPVEHKER